LLYELATEVQPAKGNQIDPIPVPFELSSWARDRSPLADWMAEELKRKYGVEAKRGKRWIENSVILPILDGLDEVSATYRKACLEKIREYGRKYCGIKFVLSCRDAK
jgi:predicted NACHT family NTPase